MTALAELPGYDLTCGQVAIGAHVNRNGHTVIASGERFWGAAGKITVGGVLLASAGLLLLALAVAMGVVSWHAQYAFIFAIKHQRLRGRARGARPGLRRRGVLASSASPGPSRPPRA